MEFNNETLIETLMRYLHTRYKNISMTYIEPTGNLLIQFNNIFTQKYTISFCFGPFDLAYKLNQLQNDENLCEIFGDVIWKIDSELNKHFKSLLYY